LKPPGTKRLKLDCDVLLSISAFKFKLRRYSVVSHLAAFMRELTPAARLPHLHLLPAIGAADGDMIGNWRLRAGAYTRSR
jgi:hypothetical protein